MKYLVVIVGVGLEHFLQAQVLKESLRIHSWPCETLILTDQAPTSNGFLNLTDKSLNAKHTKTGFGQYLPDTDLPVILMDSDMLAVGPCSLYSSKSTLVYSMLSGGYDSRLIQFPTVEIARAISLVWHRAWLNRPLKTDIPSFNLAILGRQIEPIKITNLIHLPI